MTDGQDLFQQIASAGARMQPPLSDRDVERLVQGAHRRRRRRALRRLALFTVAGTTAAVVLAIALPRSAKRAIEVAQVQPARPGGPAQELQLADGSLVTPLGVGSEIAVTEQSTTRVGVALRHGGGRFKVAPRPLRSFQVRAGDVTVTVVGTVFTVERIADRVGVVVERGSVRVEWDRGSRSLHQGESGWFPPLRADPAAESATVPPPARKSSRARTIAAARPATPANAPAEPSSSAEGLLLAADRARIAGRPEEGVRSLRRLLREHRRDPRAPLAAFTLGRVLLMELAQPEQAAAAFAEVRQLAPQGSFAEDALAREVEAWRQARQSGLARERAREYLRLYPGGRRTAAVRAMGGLE